MTESVPKKSRRLPLSRSRRGTRRREEDKDRCSYSQYLQYLQYSKRCLWKRWKAFLASTPGHFVRRPENHQVLRHFLIPEGDRASAKRWLLDACIQAGCYENAMNCRTAPRRIVETTGRIIDRIFIVVCFASPTLSDNRFFGIHFQPTRSALFTIARSSHKKIAL